MIPWRLTAQRLGLAVPGRGVPPGALGDRGGGAPFPGGLLPGMGVLSGDLGGPLGGGAPFLASIIIFRSFREGTLDFLALFFGCRRGRV